MSSIVPAGQTPFDSIRHVDEQGNEFWSARELMPLLEYNRWNEFESAILRAKQDCIKSKRAIEQNFWEGPKVSGKRGPGSHNYYLSKYACHLIVMTSRTTGDTAAQARTYFSDTVDLAEQSIIVESDEEIEQWKERAIRALMSHGFSYAYANNRVNGILVRKDIEKRWVLIGMTDEEIGILTNQMHMGTFGISIDQHRALKQFPEIREGTIIRHKGNLRPALTPIEQAIITFAESVTLALHDERDTYGFIAAARDVDDGASFAKDDRLKWEKMTGKPVISPRNMLKEPDGGMFGDPMEILQIEQSKEEH